MFVLNLPLILDLTICMWVTLEVHVGDIRRVVDEITSYHKKD
jgi:hypothetical protein